MLDHKTREKNISFIIHSQYKISSTDYIGYSCSKFVKLLSEMLNEAAVITSHPFPANILVMQLQKNKYTLIKHGPHMPYFHTAFGSRTLYPS